MTTDSSTTPRCCSVYVANIPLSVDIGRLKMFFSSVGTVLHAKLLLDIATGMSRGVAFVMFESVEIANKACQLINRAVLDGNALQVRLSERSSVYSCLDSHVKSNIVYIRNIPGYIAPETVRCYCESNFGPVEDVSLHPQSFFLGGPSPYNMVFVQFLLVPDACKCVESVDGKAPFLLPSVVHPFTLAKMIVDVGAEKRKSIVLRVRKPTSGSLRSYISNSTAVKQQPPSYVDSTNVDSIICGAPTQFIRPRPVLSLIVPFQNTENYLTVLHTPFNTAKSPFASQGCITTTNDLRQILLVSTQAGNMPL